MARVAATHAATESIDQAAAEVFAALQAEGLDALLLKGAALAALLYEPGEHRSYSDVDVLVAPRDVQRAEEVLSALGYTNADSVTGVDDVGGVVHAHTWVRSGADGGTMVDLHHWLSGAEGAPDAAWGALLENRTSIELAGRHVAILDRGGQAMHLALHAAQHGGAYGRQIDELALAIERWPRETWDAAAELADRIGATRRFAAGLRLFPRGAEEAGRLGLPSTDAEDWAIRHRSERPRGTFHLAALADATGAAGRLGVVRRALFPNRAWMEHQYPAAKANMPRLAGAYLLHVLRAPLWAARAWRFRRRAARAAQIR